MSIAPDINRALAEVGDAGKSTAYTVALPVAADAGTWRLRFVGRVTAPLVRWATPAQVLEALEALPNIGPGNVQVSGIVGGPFEVGFAGALAAQSLPLATFPFVGLGADLTGEDDLEWPPAISLVQKEVGASPKYLSQAQSIWDASVGVADGRRRFLLLKRALLDLLLGATREDIDRNVDGNIEELDQRFQHVKDLRRLVGDELGEADDEARQARAAARAAPAAAKIRKTTPNGLPYGQLR